MTMVKAICAFVFLAAFILVQASAAPSEYDLFEQWCIKHGKFYNGVDEKTKRFEVFRDNLRFVNTQNSMEIGFRLELNKHADMSHDEFKARYLGHRKVAEVSATPFKYGSVTNIPDSVDWRQKNAVTYVRDQGQCGSCWSFSAIGAVEGINAIVTKELTALSEQELVDCDKNNSGCNGGLMDTAFDFIINNGGIDKEENYPYLARDGVCDEKRKNSHAVSIDGYEDVPREDTTALLKAIAHQPVSVAIDASSRDFQFYKSGVFTGHCGADLNHGVLAVGYGTEEGKDYIIIKNSWGPDWGDEGYMKMERIVDKVGKCGINLMASYPIKNGPNPPPSPPTPTPSPPAPAPAELCDEYNVCPAGTTCCCVFKYGNFCFSWGCCPIPSAICCSDGRHCCPSDFPLCNLKRNTCMKSAHDRVGVDMKLRFPAIELDRRTSQGTASQ